MEAPPAAIFPLDQTFQLSSRSAATKTIYLDFDGHTTSGTAWNNGGTIVTPAYSVDGSSAFSDTELLNIQNIWARVTESFSPFDVNVTTEEPVLDDLRKVGAGDQRWGIRVVIGPDAGGLGGGGVAYLGSFNRSSDTPCFVFSERLGSASSIAYATSHEVGHSLGLRHDAVLPAQPDSNSYYSGHGTGATSWAPIMGAGYSRQLVQWSKGEYLNANNAEDDLAIITGAVTTTWTPNGNGFGYRPDDHGNTIGTATLYAGSGFSGVIERNTDVDVFQFYTGSTINIAVQPVQYGPNLDVLAELLDSTGAVIQTSNPADALNASFTTTVSAGTYFLRVQGTGKGDPLGTGYTNYGSLGQYTVSVTVDAQPKIVAVEDRVGTLQGVIPSGGRTNDPQPIIRGGGAPGAVMTVRAGSLSLGTTTVAADATWSFVVTAPLSDLTYQLIVSDSLGGASSVPYTITVDTVAPTILITRAGSGTVKAGGTETIAFTLSESLTTFVSGDVTTTGGTLTNFAGSGTTYTATFTPAAAFTGSATVSVAAGAFTDTAGNANVVGGPLSISVDTVAPTVAITRAGSTTLNIGSTDTITFTLSEVATDFVIGDVTTTGGMLTNFTAVSATVYTATFTPSATFQGTATVTVAAAKFTDASGNPNLAASLNVAVDTLPPTVTITRSGNATLKIGSTDTITFTLSEAATDFVSSDVATTGGTLTNFAGSGTTYTATFTPAAAFTGSATVSVAASTFTDTAGNANAVGGSLSISVDTVSPTITITRAGTGTLKIGSTDTITFTLSESSTNFGSGDVTTTGGTLTSFAGSGTTYTATFIPNAAFTGPATVSVAASTFTDTAGNANAVGGSLLISVDTVAPTITITRAGTGTLKIGSTETITFSLSESSTDFTVGDVTVAGGTLSNFTAVSATVYTATFTPWATFQGTATVTVAAAKFTDASGNPNQAASLNVAVDTLPPTVTITRSGNATLKIGSTDTITFTLSESSTTFVSSDVTTTGGTLTNFAGSGTTYTATFTPNASFTGSAKVSVAAGAFSDASGNQNITGRRLALSVDTARPTVVTFGSSTPSGQYGLDREIPLSATISESVAAGGSLTVLLNTGASVALIAKTNGNTLVGSYVVRLGDYTENLKIEAMFQLSDAPVTDLAGNGLVDTTLPNPSNGLGAGRVIAIAGQLQATSPGLGTSISDAVVRSGEVRSIPIVFNAPVVGLNISAIKLRLHGRSISLSGARIVGSGASYTLTLPKNRTSLRGAYTIEVYSAEISSGSTHMLFPSVISWVNRPAAKVASLMGRSSTR